MNEILNVANNSDMIVNGYAFKNIPSNLVRVINLNNLDHRAVFNRDGLLIESTMDDIEAVIAQKYFLKNKKYLED